MNRVLYPPLDSLKPVTDDVWIVDSGPLRAFALPIPVRMTVVRLQGGELWLHSPTRFTPELKEALSALGRISHLIAPSVAHWSFVKEWQQQCAGAIAWAAPGLSERSPVKKSGVRFDAILGPLPAEWADELEQINVPGGFGANEVAFFHRRSRTLILTDLVENFEPEKLSRGMRLLVRLMGAMAPDGKAPLHYRFAINRKREQAAAAARRIIAWAPERVIFAHGRWFESEGTRRLRRSLRWLLD
jgi:Domain of unknown function (DUF4336)